MSSAVPTAPYAFVSYASAERERALEVADALERAGVAVWLDRRSIAGGTSWSAEIVQGIEGCAALVLLVSPAAMASPNVAQEVQLAWEARRPLLPLLLAPAEPPPTLRYALAGRQWVELLGRPPDAWQPDLARALDGLGLLPQGPPSTEPATPPASPAAAPRHNLPRQMTSFVGREGAIAAIGDLLDTAALVTLVGVGGTGKTRLALAAAERVLGSYPDGVWLVELAALVDPALVSPAVATALHVREQPGEPLLATLLAALAPQVLLLVLDNCEHLIDACARLAEALLRHCPGLRILATSREQLGVPGEVPYRVPSLALPDPDAPVADLAEAEAVRLFLARAGAARPGFALTEANAPHVARVCARLDGIPLALELAAVRLRALPVEQLAQRLDDRFRLLTGGSRTALPRQQTLQATVDWSYHLLDEGERLLFRRLSVFAGGWTLDAAEAVCADEALEAWRVLDLLTGLADKSLVVLDETSGDGRYRLLETVRQYARERLGETDGGAAVRDRHRDWCLTLAEQAEPLLESGQQWAWLARLDAEVENLRAALEWCQAGEAETGLRLATRLYRYWSWGRAAEGADWLARLLALAVAPTSERARALGRLGSLVYDTGTDRARAEAVLRESVALSRDLRAAEPLYFALRQLRHVLFSLHGPAGRAAVQAEALALSRELGDRSGEGELLRTTGLDAALGGDLPRARLLLDESLALLRAAGDDRQIRMALIERGTVEWWAGDYDQTLRNAEELDALARDTGAEDFAFSAGLQRGRVAWARGEGARALAHSAGLLARMERARWPWLYVPRLALARAALAAGEVARAQTLLAEALPRARDLTGEAHYWLGRAAQAGGDRRGALRHLRAALRVLRARGEWVAVPDTLEAVAAALIADGPHAAAVRLLAAADATRTVWGAPRPPVEQPGMDATLASARAALGEGAFNDTWATGTALTLQDAADEALALLDSHVGEEAAV